MSIHDFIHVSYTGKCTGVIGGLTLTYTSILNIVTSCTLGF